MRYLILIYLLVIPCFYIPGLELRPIQEIAFRVMSLVIFFFSFFVKNREIDKPFAVNSMNTWLGAFGLLTVTHYAFGSSSQFLFNVVCALMVYFACIKTLKKEDIVFLSRAIVYFAIINIAYVALQRFGYDPIFQVKNASSDSTGVVWTDDLGFFGLKAVMGMYVGIAMCLLAMFNWWIAILFFLPIVVSVSSGAVLGGASGYLFYLWWKKRLFFWIFSVFILIGAVFYVVKIDSPMGMMKTRPPMWGMALKRSFLDVRGYGLDSFRNGKVRYYKEATTDKTVGLIAQDKDGTRFYVAPENRKYDWWDNPHNEFIQLFYEFGLAGVVIIAFLFWCMACAFKRAVKTNELVAVTAAIIALLMASMTQFPFHLARIGNLTPILLAFFYLETQDA